MRALAIVNPRATSTSERTRDVLLAALSNDLDLTVAETTHRGHATELAERARTDRCDLLIAVGGDGTINELVNGVLSGRDDGEHLPDIAIVPGGSTNVLARNLGIPENPVEATGLLLDALREGRRQPLGLGRIGDRYFTFTAGAGLDAEVIRSVEEARKDGDNASPGLYVTTAVRRFAHQPDRRRGVIELRPAAGVPAPPLLNTVLISNCSPWTYVGRRPLRPTPAADFNAGLDVFGLTSLGILPTIASVAQMALQRGPRGRHVVTLHDLAEFSISAPRPVPFQVDGDYIGDHEHLLVTSVPRAVRIAY